MSVRRYPPIWKPGLTEGELLMEALNMERLAPVLRPNWMAFWARVGEMVTRRKEMSVRRIAMTIFVGLISLIKNSKKSSRAWLPSRRL